MIYDIQEIDTVLKALTSRINSIFYIMRVIQLLILMIIFFNGTQSANSSCFSVFKKIFFQQKMNLPNLDTLISESEEFKNWLKTTKNPYASDALELAKNINWGEALVIDQYKGVKLYQLTKGCSHQCIGCSARCDTMIGGIKKIKWEDFSVAIRRLKGLEDALYDISGNRYQLFSNDWNGPYLNSDPMNHRLHSNQNIHGILEIVKYFKQVTGKPMDIWTSGWEPKDAFLQRNAQELNAVLVKANKEELLVQNLQLEFKTMSREFKKDVELFMSEVLVNDQIFVKEHYDDYMNFKFEFDKYSKPKDSFQRYSELVHIYWSEIISSSGYMQDRISNLKTLLGAINKHPLYKIVFYKTSNKDLSMVPKSILPFLEDSKRLSDHINSVYFDGKIKKMKFQHVDWLFDVAYRRPISETLSPEDVMFTVEGSIRFDRDGASRYFMVNSNNPYIRSLAHRPILFNNHKKPWEIARDRLDTTQEPYLSEDEKLSVTSRIKETNKRFLNSSIVINQKAEYKEIGNKLTPVVNVIVDGEEFMFDFVQGAIK